MRPDTTQLDFSIESTESMLNYAAAFRTTRQEFLPCIFCRCRVWFSAARHVISLGGSTTGLGAFAIATRLEIHRGISGFTTILGADAQYESRRWWVLVRLKDFSGRWESSALEERMTGGGSLFFMGEQDRWLWDWVQACRDKCESC